MARWRELDPGRQDCVPWRGASRQIETTLGRTGRIEVNGIYTASATMKPASEPVLKEIADALTKNPSWKLNAEGHTDNIGGDAYNLDLSRLRRIATQGDQQHARWSRAQSARGVGAAVIRRCVSRLESSTRSRRRRLAETPMGKALRDAAEKLTLEAAKVAAKR